MLSLQLCLTLCDPMDCSWPGSSVHGISQARILEWVAISFSRDLPDEPASTGLAGRFFTAEPPRKPTPAAAAKSLRSCPTLCDPIDGSPPGSPVPEIFQARVGCHFLLQCVKVKSECKGFCATPWTAACQDPLSVEFSRQKYWSGLQFPTPG